MRNIGQHDHFFLQKIKSVCQASGIGYRDFERWCINSQKSFDTKNAAGITSLTLRDINVLDVDQRNFCDLSMEQTSAVNKQSAQILCLEKKVDQIIKSQKQMQEDVAKLMTLVTSMVENSSNQRNAPNTTHLSNAENDGPPRQFIKYKEWYDRNERKENGSATGRILPSAVYVQWKRYNLSAAFDESQKMGDFNSMSSSARNSFGCQKYKMEDAVNKIDTMLCLKGIDIRCHPGVDKKGSHEWESKVEATLIPLMVQKQRFVTGNQTTKSQCTIEHLSSSSTRDKRDNGKRGADYFNKKQRME